MTTSKYEQDLRFFGEEERKILDDVLKRQQLCYYDYNDSLNPVGVGYYINQFQDKFAAWMKLKHALAVNSGTSALEGAMAGCEIGPGDEVIVSGKSFIASSISVVALGAVPVFADVDPRNGCLDPAEVERKVTEHTKAIMPVHIYGQPADMDGTMNVAKKHDLYVIEDAAEAYGALYKGRLAGALGDVAAFSLQQTKHFTTGEGGIIVTDNSDIFVKAATFTNVGAIRGAKKPEPDFHFFSFGHNYRMGQLQAAVAVAQLSKIDIFNKRRQHLVDIIEKELRGVSGIQMPYVYPETVPSYWGYHIVLDEKLRLLSEDVVRLCMEEEKVELWLENAFWHRTPSYLEPVFREMNVKRKTSLGQPLPDYVRYEKGTCPKLESVAPRSIVIPVHHGIRPEVIAAQAAAIRKVVERRTRRAD
ncbi:MAG: DegT/DnrJ/EryC1/StrS family aminotransferase [Candidatus Bathyarchaeia archaeon]